VETFLALGVAGLVMGCIYALTACGLVVTYTTSGIFNFAHGAVGMVAAFAYWELSVARGLPGPVALALVVLVLAPALGVAVERLLLRRLAGASLEVTLTVTVGLLLFLIGLVHTVWEPTTTYRVPAFFFGEQVTVAGVVLTAHQLVIVVAAVLVAGGLWAFLHVSRTGVTLRAVVDDRELAALTGASPARVSMLGWGLGSALAALAGVLLASQVQLNAVTLTLLVINGYAAAVVGRLTNLPLTFLGGLLLGLAQAMAVGYLTLDWLSQVQPVIPMVFLLVALLVLPQARLRTGQVSALTAPRVAGGRESLLVAAGFVALAVTAAALLSDRRVDTVTHGMAVALILLSLVPLTGYGGQVSLCQLTFAGIGAVTMARVDGGSGSVLALTAAVAVPAAVGAMVALPALRLRGLYLALATLAFAYAMEDAFFSNASVMTDSLSLSVPRPDLGLPLDDDRAYLVAVCVLFAACGCGVLALRRSTLGRRLVAMGDSPTGCATLGMGLRATKLAVFALSAGMAGLGGAVLGGQQGAIGSNDFGLILSLTLLLLAVIWGIKTVTGVLLAGLFLELGPLLQDSVGSAGDVVPLLVGLGAIGIGSQQNGVVGGFLDQLRRHRRVRPAAPPDDAAPGADRPEEVLAGAAR
jgi:branched-chain amino acid transport system permease protein